MALYHAGMLKRSYRANYSPCYGPCVPRLKQKTRMNLPILTEIASCTLCSGKLPYAPRPVLVANSKARLLIVGQAPGRRVQESGIPWSDASGKQLRTWLDLPPDVFYDPEKVAILPMGFCYPGTGRQGDLPPRPECAPMWHARLLALMPQIRLTLLIGAYSQAFYLTDTAGRNLTETVANWRAYLPTYFPLPHPSPRNRLWLRRNPWFDTEVVPVLRKAVQEVLQ